MSNPKVRAMQMAGAATGPECIVQLEDGRMFKLRGHEDSDDGLRWEPLPDFPLTDEQVEQRETARRARAAGLTVPGER